MEQGKHSEIARLRERLELEEETARLGLSGYAITARHAFITARMERSAERILRLVSEGRHSEAQALMNTEYWEEENSREEKQKTVKGEAQQQ